MFAPSIVYAPGDPWLTLLERLALLPVMPVSGRGRAKYQPIWAEDVADCVIAALHAPATARSDTTERFELAGPQTLSHNEIVRTVLRSLDRTRPLLHVPTPIVSRGLRLLEATTGQRAFATWDEAELMEVPMISGGGVADAEGLGVTPAPMAAVLGRRLSAPPGPLEDRLGLGRAALGPRDRLLELGGKRQQRRLARGTPDELHAQRQPVLALKQGQRDPGLAGRVEQRREGREQARARERGHRVSRGGVQRPSGSGRSASAGMSSAS